jgi:two-component system sensor histidine kinase KdpD
MSAGVGKTYRMLQEAHGLLENGIDVKIGYIETHNRKETHALLDGLPIIPRRKLFYKGKELEELDVQAVLNLRPEVVIIDELANIEGSKNEKKMAGRYGNPGFRDQCNFSSQYSAYRKFKRRSKRHH